MMRSREEFLPRTSQRPSTLVVTFWRSTVGKKIVMAATDAIGVGYLIGHVTGNLLVFLGPAKIDASRTMRWTPLQGGRRDHKNPGDTKSLITGKASDRS
jgi:hypothetical protein